MKTHRESKSRPRTANTPGAFRAPAISESERRREALASFALALAASFAGFGVWRWLNRETPADIAWAGMASGLAAAWLIAWRTASASVQAQFPASGWDLRSNLDSGSGSGSGLNLAKGPRRSIKPADSRRSAIGTVLMGLGLAAAFAGASGQTAAGMTVSLLFLFASAALRLIPNLMTFGAIALGTALIWLACYPHDELARQAPAILTALAVLCSIGGGWAEPRHPSALASGSGAIAVRRGLWMDRAPVSAQGIVAIERRLFSQTAARPRTSRVRLGGSSSRVGASRYQEISWLGIREELANLYSSRPVGASMVTPDLTTVSAQERNPVASAPDAPTSQADELRVFNPDDVLTDQVAASDADTKVELLASEKEYLSRGSASAPTPSSARRPPPDPAKILVAEDSADIRRIISLFLRQAGYQHELAVNGRFAVERAGTEEFDLILMDMQMPELDGYGATRALRERGFEIPIIAVTAHTLSGSREECLAAGCTDYLPKPINRRDLVNLIERHLHLAKAKTVKGPPVSSPPASPSAPSASTAPTTLS